MQEMCEPPHSRVLRSFQGSPLFYIARIASGCESVRHAGKVLIIIFDVQAGNHRVGMRFLFWGEFRVMLRGDDLNGNGNRVNSIFGNEAGMRRRNTVDQVLA